MELIDQCQKSLYEKCKYKVKLWEHKFKKNNGRLPSKLDIKEAELEVRNAYKTYFQLKTNALEHSFRDVEGFLSDEEIVDSEINLKNHKNPLDNELKEEITDSTWGFHLNKTFPTKESVSEHPDSASNLNLKITQKLSVGSKLIKRNPRKALSQIKNETSFSFTSSVPKNSNVSISSEKLESSNSYTVHPLSANLEVDSSKCFNFRNIKDVPIVQSTYSPNIKSVHTTKNETKLKFQNIDLDWLARVESSTNIVKENENEKSEVDFASDEDIIDNSDDEFTNSQIVKKVKHNNGSISCFKMGEHQQPHNTSVSSNVDTSANEIKKIKIDHITTPGVQVHDLILKEGIQKNDHMNEIIDTQQSVCKTFINSESNKEIKKVGIVQPPESSKKLKGKNLNENFVRINLRKKVYARGKKSHKFSKFKKKTWKSKHKFSQETEEGIAIRDNVLPDKLLPLDAADEDILVTLDQASGKDISNEIPLKKLIEVQEEEDSDEDMTLSEIKKLMVEKNKKVEQSGSKNLQSQVKENKRTLKRKKKVEKTVVNSVAYKSRKQTITNNIEAQNETTKQGFRAKTDAKSQNQRGFPIEFDDDLDLLSEALRLEHTLNNRKVCPLYQTEDDGTVIDTPQEVYDALRLFGHESFREGQEKAVMRILSGKSTLVTLSTGSGKSLCYQLSAYLFRQKYNCITLVISPLISLMEDQIKCIPGILNAACIHGNQTKTQRDIVLKAVASGEVNILMVSPESIMSHNSSSGFGSLVSHLPPIAFACLDEAHCLSQWSHNFRPSYLVVCKILQEILGVEVILGLTATATKTTRNSLINQLKIPDGENGIISDTPVPSNLSLSISKDPNKDEALLQLLLSEPFINFRSIIIYCLRRDECEKVATFLRTTLKNHSLEVNSKRTKNMSLVAEPYHAGLSAARRKAIQRAFISDQLRIIVATIAFGMGINKSDIRCVIHYSMPAKFESYVQEIGRAGRDNGLAKCHVFLDKENGDIFEHCRHIYGNSVDRHIIRKLLRKVFPSCNCEGICTKHEVMFSMDSTVQELDVSKEILATILCYLELDKNQYIKMLKPSYANCKILSYGGRDLINRVALSCKPLEFALTVLEDDDKISNSIRFPVLPVARAINCDAGMCKNILKNLEWTNVSGQPKRSSLTVEFFDLSFHLLSPGNLPDTALDEVLDSLYEKILEQENTAYSQLIHFNMSLSKYSSATFNNSLTDNEERSELLKQDIREYFESEKPFELVCIPEISETDKSFLISDIRSLVSRYHDNNFSGRTVAKIFHGIPSPNVPAYVWGRTIFWRKYLKIHFNIICKIATQELIKMQL